MTMTENMERTAVISKCGRYRYLLTRRWAIARPALCAIMLNPSTADATKDDPTITRLMRRAMQLNCGELRVVNLFAYRTPHPTSLLRRFNAGLDIEGPQNDHYIKEAMFPLAHVLVAWGNHKLVDLRSMYVLQTIIGREFVQPECLGLTKDSYPRHPLHVSYATPLIPYTGRHAPPVAA